MPLIEASTITLIYGVVIAGFFSCVVMVVRNIYAGVKFLCAPCIMCFNSFSGTSSSSQTYSNV